MYQTKLPTWVPLEPPSEERKLYHTATTIEHVSEEKIEHYTAAVNLSTKMTYRNRTMIQQKTSHSPKENPQWPSPSNTLPYPQ
jgi:uncharacterized protein YqiB (DUF1249 family)